MRMLALIVDVAFGTALFVGVGVVLSAGENVTAIATSASIGLDALDGVHPTTSADLAFLRSVRVATSGVRVRWCVSQAACSR